MRRISGVISVAALLAVSAAMAQEGPWPATPGPAQRTTGDSIGPYNKQIVDPAAADRGRHLYAAECVDCHGPTARGVDNNGPNLIRSNVVLHDRVGSELGPFLRKGHPLQSKASSANLTDSQIADLSHFLKQRVDDALKREPMGDHINIITGDVAAGKAYFEGEGKCAGCHALTGTQPGSLAGISARYPDGVNLQQAMLFPTGRGRGGRAGGRGASTAPVMLTVTPAGGQPITGELVFLDDFDAQLRDSAGKLHTFTRTPALKVVKTDPLQAHHELLDRITDKNMHDLVVYLETVK